MAAKVKYAGVDMSYCQTNVDYKALKAGKICGKPVKFAMLRFSYGAWQDTVFDTHYRGCKEAGIYVGVYHWLRAQNVAQAREEAQWLVDKLRNYDIDYPVALDFEDEKLLALGLSKAQYTAIVNAFMDVLVKANYYVVLYTYTNCLLHYLQVSVRTKYDLWIADYTGVAINYGQTMWQYGIAGHPQFDTKSVGAVDGVPGQCDVNWAYVGYAAKIRKLGKNKPVIKYKVTGTKTVTKQALAQAQAQLKALGFEVRVEEVNT